MTSLSPQVANSPIPVAPISSAPLVVHALESQDAERWDRFVLRHPAGTFFHQMAWKQVLEKTFDHKAQYVYAERGGEIVAVAPVFMVSNWMVGRCLVSSPLASYGGICAEDDEADRHCSNFSNGSRESSGWTIWNCETPAAGLSRGLLPIRVIPVFP